MFCGQAGRIRLQHARLLREDCFLLFEHLPLPREVLHSLLVLLVRVVQSRWVIHDVHNNGVPNPIHPNAILIEDCGQMDNLDLVRPFLDINVRMPWCKVENKRVAYL